MVTVKDDGDAKSGEQGAQSGAPSSPPPTYAQVAAARPKPAQQPSQPAPSAAPTPAPRPPQQSQHVDAVYVLPGPASPTHRTFGPTPLPTTTNITATLPYYDPRSEWALREAASRAKRRFFGALLWGLLVWLVVGSIIGGTVGGTTRRRRHGSWAVA